MVNCTFYPEKCIARNLYSDKRSKFNNSRIKDATIQKSDVMNTLKSRIKDEEWKKIYPINNHDFDYKEFILNNYNPYKLGITNTPSIDGLLSSTIKSGKYAKTILEDPVPNKSTVAGKSDVNNSSSSVYRHMKKVKDRYNDMPTPYVDFKKDYPEKNFPTKGEFSSSYFMKVGHCKSNIKDEYECKRKGFTWVDNSIKSLSENVKGFFSMTSKRKTKRSQPKENPKGLCYRPKFIYVDNSAKGALGMRGLAPSTNYDVMSVTPDKLFPILAGYSTGDGGLLPCTKEGFTSDNNNVLITSISFLLIITLFIFVFKNV